MIPARMDDPRSSLDKATRDELWAFAKAVGVNDVREPMPADLCRQLLRARGFTNIKLPDPRILGLPNGFGAQDVQPATETVDALDMLKRDYERQQASPDVPWVDVDSMSGHEIRKTLKRLGVEMSRKDTLDVLKAKLRNVENPSQ